MTAAEGVVASKKSKKEKDAAPTKAADPLALDNFSLSAPVKAQLVAKGIQSLFPIQAQTLQIVLDGADLVGRARTGCGKTLAFVLPIVEKLVSSSQGKRAFGRTPKVIVLAPTRELAKQVAADFDYVGKAVNLATACLYGGTQYSAQENMLRRGLDVVVGTPGRIKDHLERGSLKLASLMFRVLDECDEMLNMGFVDDVETILGAQTDTTSVQTLLFSATLPVWVKNITKRFLKPTYKTVDLVGTEKMKASASVRHMVLPCHWSQRPTIVADLVRCYGALGRSIVFTETKKDANELTTSLGENVGARALHGDIPQNQREVTLAAFRAAKFEVLVATDVAARGLDINGVELVIQIEPPKDPETYIHRSGRTGRAGSTGVSVTLVDRKKEGLIPYIEKKAGVQFERIGAPQPRDMAKAAGERAVEAIQAVDESVIPWFKEAAQKLLAEASSPEDALAMALAKITGHTAMKARSLLTAHEDYTTLLFTSDVEILRPGFVFGFLRKRLSDAIVEEVKRMTLTADGKQAVFDVLTKDAKEVISKCGLPAGASAGETSLARGTTTAPHVSIPVELPALKPREGGGDFGSSGGGYGGGGGGYGGGRGGYGSVAAEEAEAVGPATDLGWEAVGR
ncbi:hypothetical protein WJX72_001159 [[Myrmecia] bisecta]|uniref:RNA helicase n=1 Tax=[Myrmecia] bisecta TaxID=41462 RepID=A0AAW1QP82_9CHLO